MRLKEILSTKERKAGKEEKQYFPRQVNPNKVAGFCKDNLLFDVPILRKAQRKWGVYSSPGLMAMLEKKEGMPHHVLLVTTMTRLSHRLEEEDEEFLKAMESKMPKRTTFGSNFDYDDEIGDVAEGDMVLLIPDSEIQSAEETRRIINKSGLGRRGVSRHLGSGLTVKQVDELLDRLQGK